jgi:predicted MFS family arabinose efflux permease
VAATPARRPICFAMGVAAPTRHQRWAPVVLLALVVGLQAADIGTVGALVVPLAESLQINHFQVGLLVTVSTGVGAIATLFAGPLADRTNRVRCCGWRCSRARWRWP